MADLPTAETVVRDIEFELLQGAIPSDELGRSIQALRQYQGRLRRELLDADQQAADHGEAIRKLLQTNDMLLTLLQETAVRLLSLQVELRQVSHLLPDGPTAEFSGATGPAIKPAPGPGQHKAEGRSPDEAGSYLPGRYPIEVDNARTSEALYIEPDVHPIRLPLLGAFFTRFRNALHNLPLFYVRRLAEKQAAINATYGDWILALNMQNQRQQAQIQALCAKLAALETGPAETDRETGTGGPAGHHDRPGGP